MRVSLQNKIVVITGASSGIGEALARELFRRGCRLGLIARRGDRLDSIANELSAVDRRVATAVADVSVRGQLVDAIAQIKNELGPIDIMIANAGIGPVEKVDPLQVDEIELMMRTNYLGTVYSVAAVLPEMLQRGSGQLVAISSLAAYKGLPGCWGYSASKAAINAFMEGLRLEVRDRGVRVTTICPGYVRTPLTEHNVGAMPGLMEPDAAARRIVRAMERCQPVLNFPWSTAVQVEVARWLPDWLVARLAPREETSDVTTA